MKKQLNTSINQHAVGFLMIAILFTLLSCGSNPNQTTTEVEAPEMLNDSVFELSNTQFNSSGMKLGKLEMQTFHKKLKANGMIDVPPENKASVSPYFGGTVKSILLIPGEKVKKGQALFVLENPDFVQMQQDYLEAKGQLTYLKSDYERQKNLAQDNVTSQKTFLKAEADYNVTQVRMQALGKKLSLMGLDPERLTMENIQTQIVINSPINGYVTEINITRGAFLNPAQAAMTIVNTEQLLLELNIFEKDLQKVQVGQLIEFKLQNDNSAVHKASVHLVNKTIDPEFRTIRVYGHLAEQESPDQFSPGMYLEAEIFTTSESKPALPVDAAVDIDGKFYVLLRTKTDTEGYTFVKKEVQLGESNSGFVEIRNSQEFDENSEILISGAFNVITE